MKPLARYAALNNYVELGQKLGLDPAALAREVGLDPAGFSLQDRWIPAEAVADLLERSAAASSRQDFGLMLAGYRRLANLGPLSLVIREEPDVRSALGVLMRHQHMYNEALRLRLSELGGVATVRVTLDVGRPGEFRQSVELAIAVVYQLLQGFIAPEWDPLSVSFMHPPPRNDATHVALFGDVVRFDQDFNGISLYSKELDTPNAMSDPELRRYAKQLLDDLDDAPDPTAEFRVRQLIEMLLPTGRCSVDQVARSLGVDRRTVHRRLTAEGLTFSEVLDATRMDLARHLVNNPRYPLIEVSELLGFGSPGNFSRWFRARFGQSPSQWRRAGSTRRE
ncbi:AraC family transcriptional regulator [Gordonia sp. CPCC 205515]|uniref:AraC family transcriptional regulator n=1 Tax=Gordonia sp. CPCC 205515 TaxID=3140791 RepID=UPI003AF3A7AF